MSWRGTAFTALLVGLVYWGVRPLFIEQLGVQLYLAIVVAVVILIAIATASWQARRQHYECGNCEHVFHLSTGRHLRSQNWFGRVHTHCPSCKQTSSCAPVSSG